jgi:hypothetical protein
MADDDNDVDALDPLLEFDEEDDPKQRVESFDQLFGRSAVTYEQITDAARRHARDAAPDPQATGWLPLGPRNVGGAVRCISQNPQRPNELAAGAAQGGVWKSVDDGYSWRPTGGDALFGAVGAIAYAPSNPRTVYAGSGELFFQYPGGIGFFKSTDGGETFTRLVDGQRTDDGSAAHYARIAVDPHDDDRAWIATDRGLWLLKGSSFDEQVITGVPAKSPVTDVAVTEDPTFPGKYLLLVGILGGPFQGGVLPGGIAQGVYDRSSKKTVWTLNAPPAPWTAAGSFGVVRVAWSPGVPRIAYAIAEDLNAAPPAPLVANNTRPTVLFHSRTFGASWSTPAPPPPAGPAPAPAPPAITAAMFPEHVTNPLYIRPGQAGYTLTLAVDPRDSSHVVVGCLDLNRTPDGGLTWVNILDSNLYDNGDRAQHADQSFVTFDARRANAIWVANDGGISFAADCRTRPVTHVPRPGYFGAFAAALTPKPVWRKRSFGISAAQLFDLTTHPVFPVLYGGGFQDNGTFVSYGGPSWYEFEGADGGAMAFHPTSPFRMYATTQAGVTRVDVVQFPPAPPVAGALPPLHASVLPDVPAPANVHAPNRVRMRLIASNTALHFIRALVAHPTAPDFLLLGAQNALQYSNDALNFARANVALPAAPPPPPPPPPFPRNNVTAVTFAAPPSTDMWAGTDAGTLFVNGAALPVSSPIPPAPAQPAWAPLAGFPPAGAPAVRPITAIAVHPTDGRIVAVSTGINANTPGGVFLTHDRGVNWISLDPGGNALPASAFLAVAFDPVDVRTLYLGTAAGVYVARDLPAFPYAPPPAAPPAPPTWRTFNSGLPPVPVTDLEVSPVTRTLRCATFGRGAFEASLGNTTPAAFVLPAVALLVRDHAADDGRAYAPANTLGGDPRIGTAAAPGAPPLPPAPPAVPAPAANAAGPIDVTHSPDIAVDAPRFARFEAFAFGEPIDAVEMDENLVRDEPLVGDENAVYVQVQNRGTAVATNVDVHLYFAPAGNPAAAPAIPADLGFPNAPPASSAWQRADVITVGEIRPGEPVVVTFRWIPPLNIVDNVALMVVVTNAQDSLAALPAGAAADVVRAERRAALHVTHVQRDTIFIRDGVDDVGVRGAVPWGGRSPDILVRDAALSAADQQTAFADLRATHADDRVRAGATNFVYVKITNRTRTVIPRCVVRLFRIPRAAVTEPAPISAKWTSVPPSAALIDPPAGFILTSIPANGVGIAEFSDAVEADPDPDGTAGGKGVIYLAMAKVTDAAGTTDLDPFPDFAEITKDDVGSFWRFLTGAPLASNAALRALRLAP